MFQDYVVNNGLELNNWIRDTTRAIYNSQRLQTPENPYFRDSTGRNNSRLSRAERSWKRERRIAVIRTEQKFSIWIPGWCSVLHEFISMNILIHFPVNINEQQHYINVIISHLTIM